MGRIARKIQFLFKIARGRQFGAWKREIPKNEFQEFEEFHSNLLQTGFSTASMY